ncbi:glycosyltransferase family 2 protein [Methylobacterium nodulans]|uniref:Glycosyl transferase family 2 n=1 Tax=Methylobacterium nodulans (strain LMG 21967 / CNCM I-2342 / ORS 2060) TaxID=460265 RepID=B8IGV2_METNO|nr:glycosyltransferase [Methylobacterium nodulans]ACL57827.1 glycosyl transferase family 2 [Methylobacterium nodulans ORS 2060]
MLRLGIGITTFDRAGTLSRTLDSVARHTRTPHVVFVADDGSRDGTLALLRERGVPHVTGPNRGVAWNKNRVLFYLHEVAGCDVVILMEDDTFPEADGWEEPWIRAAERFGHANFAGSWFAERFIAGAGTPEDPILCADTSGQCISFSRRALQSVGYMDTRFGRYGFEHCEHSERMRAAGFGGRLDPPVYFLIRSDLAVTCADAPAADYTGELEKNSRILMRIRQDRRCHRLPWSTLSEMRRFLGEMHRAVPYDVAMRRRLGRALAQASLRGAAEWLGQRTRSWPRGRDRQQNAA